MQDKFSTQHTSQNRMKMQEAIFSCQLSPFNADLQNLSQYLTQAILLEVCTHPKPGLVTRASNGSHQDMSIMTFAMSSAVLSKAFYELQDIGMAHAGTERELFCKVRAYGIMAERELLAVTKGVNTQRGILFAGGLLSAAAGYAINKSLGKDSLIDIVKNMTIGIVQRELTSSAANATAGEKLYKEHGITGIRGEVEQGFPSVVNAGIPALNEAFKRGAALNDALLHALLSLMTTVQDSNVIWRAGVTAGEEVKKIAADIIEKGSVFTEKGRAAIDKAGRYFEQRRISPGGSADLLSVTIALYLLDNKELPCDIF